MTDWRDSTCVTPRQVVDRGVIAAAAKRAAGRGLTFRYEGPAAAEWEGPVAVSTGDWLARECRSGDVLITTPPSTAEIAAAVVAGREPRRVVVDHFAHVELLAAAVLRHGGGTDADGDNGELELLIELALGPARIGGRTGRDAVDLASVIEQTDGVRFGGVTAAVASRGMADALHRAAEQITAAGIAAETVCVAAAEDGYDGLIGGEEVRGDAAATAGVAVRVLSRPSLETCVVDAGTGEGIAARVTLTLSRAVGRPVGEVHVRAAERHRSLLTVEGPAADVLIGDVVLLNATDGSPLGVGLPGVLAGG